MEQQQTSPQPPTAFPTIRHDGWTGEKMAIFCETLAETAVVADACEAARMGISGAYAARRRNPVFAAAWDAALSIARERLADTLLARSMEGNVEQIFRDGELVGERHFLDNRLGLAILRRLDRLAETTARATPCSCAGRSPGQTKTPQSHSFDWTLAVDALRTGDDEAVAKALALIESNEVEEVEGKANPPLHGDDDEGLDLSDRCWKDPIDDIWMTHFPPAPDFIGYESRPYDELDDNGPYERACTAEEIAILEAGRAAEAAAERAEEEALRDAWFQLLKDEAEPARPPAIVDPHETPAAPENDSSGDK
nr:hypothetical protein [Sphingomonas sp.]